MRFSSFSNLSYRGRSKTFPLGYRSRAILGDGRNAPNSMFLLHAQINGNRTHHFWKLECLKTIWGIQELWNCESAEAALSLYKARS